MIRLLAMTALLLFTSWAVSSEFDTFRDELLADFPLEEVNVHTCRRVQELGRNTVTDEECWERVDEANAKCRSLAPEYVPANPHQDDIQLLGAIAMVCPVAMVLEISFRIESGRAYVGWNELP